jgi:hypothetical protein
MILSLPAQSFAACDFANDIKAMPDGTYSYTRDCHVEVGKRVKRLALVEQQVVELEKTIELKDLALVKQKERADLWMDTSFKMNDKLQAYEAASSKSDWVHFGLGVAVTVLSVWAAGQLVQK